jgi:hypothetical protein
MTLNADHPVAQIDIEQTRRREHRHPAHGEVEEFEGVVHELNSIEHTFDCQPYE